MWILIYILALGLAHVRGEPEGQPNPALTRPGPEGKNLEPSPSE